MGWAATAALGCGGSSGDEPIPPDAPLPVLDAALPPPTKGLPPTFPMNAVTIKTFARGIQPFASPLANPSLVAFQAGDGLPWVALTGVGGVYHATAATDTYAVAIGCAGDLSSDLSIYYQGLSDTTELHLVGCDPPVPSPVHVAVELTGVATTADTEVWMGANPASGAGGQALGVDAPPGLLDVFAYSYVRGSSPRVPLQMYRVPGTLDLADAQTFSIALGTVGLPVEPHAVTLTNLDPAETVSVHSSYATPHSEVQWPVLTKDFGASAAATYATLAASLRQPDDVSNLTVTASRTLANTLLYQRQAQLALRAPIDVTQALPVLFAVNPPKLVRTGVANATWTIPLGAPSLNDLEYVASLTTSTTNADHAQVSRGLEIFVRPGWAPGQGRTTITTPDLTGLASWNDNMALAPGPVSWSAQRIDRNMSVELPPSDGRVVLESSVSGTLP